MSVRTKTRFASVCGDATVRHTNHSAPASSTEGTRSMKCLLQTNVARFAIAAMSMLCSTAHAQSVGPIDEALPTPGLRTPAMGSEPIPGGTDVFRESHGVSEQPDGSLLGLGRDYLVEWNPGGFRFLPALGEQAPYDMSLSLSVEAISRGTHSISIDREVSPSPASRVGDARVEVSRAATVTERYDVRASGMELSYVFHEVPDTPGDLVVRTRVSGPLACVGGSPDGGVLFQSDGYGGVTIGEVTGIDAAGRVSKGALRLEGDVLEMSLPDEFVREAQLPLVLDPIVSAVFLIDGTGNARNPDVAFDASTKCYMVVWEQAASATTVLIRAQRVKTNGGLLGSALVIQNGVVGRHPTVCSVNVWNRFVVAWQEGVSLFGPWDIRGRSVSAGTGSVGTTVKLALTEESEILPDAGGTAASTGDDAVIVWEEVGSGIKGVQISVSSAGVIAVDQQFTVASNLEGDTQRRPAISKSGGNLGWYAVVWERHVSGQADVRARLVDKQGSVLGLIVSVTSTPEIESDPDVDGDGTHFLCGFARSEPVDTESNDIFVRAMARTTLTNFLKLSGTEQVVENDPFDNDFDPAVISTGAKYLVAWADERLEAPFMNTIGVRELGPLGEPCGLEDAISGLGFNNHAPELASVRSGDALGSDGAIVVWTSASLAAPFESTIQGRMLEGMIGGPVVDVGGGCGNGGSLSPLGPAAIGNPDFGLALSGADAAATAAILNLAPVLPPITCGACQITPITILLNLPISSGGVTLPLPLPCEPSFLGLTLEFQCLVLGTLSNPCPSLSAGLAFSNRLQMTLGE